MNPKIGLLSKFTLLLLPLVICAVTASAEVAVSGVVGGFDGPGEIAYQTCCGIQLFSQPPGTTVTYGPDGQPGHYYFFTDLTVYSCLDYCVSGDSHMTADTATGKLRGLANAVDTTNYSRGTITDTIYFNNTSSQAVDILVTGKIEGTLNAACTVHTCGDANYQSSLAFNGPLASGYFYGDGLRSSDCSSCEYRNESVADWNQNGAFVEVTPNSTGYGATFVGHTQLPPGQSSANISQDLFVTAHSGNSSADFRNTAALQISVPPEVSFTSDSGQFLTGITAVSRKNHGGTDYDIDLPLTGTPGIECRSGGANGDYRVVVKFANPISSMGTPTVSGSAGVQSTSISNDTDVIVNLTGVTNAQTIIVTLHDLHNGAINGDVLVPMSVLVGDTNADGFVDSADISQTKSQSGNAVGSSNFHEDTNTDGFIDSADISFVKSKSGTALASQPFAASPAASPASATVSPSSKRDDQTSPKKTKSRTTTRNSAQNR